MKTFFSWLFCLTGLYNLPGLFEALRNPRADASDEIFWVAVPFLIVVAIVKSGDAPKHEYVAELDGEPEAITTVAPPSGGKPYRTVNR